MASLAKTKPHKSTQIKSGWQLFIVLSFLVLSIIELFSRLVLFPNWRDLSHPRFVKHPIYGSLQKSNLKIRRFNPNNYDVINTTNSMGFRDREIGFTEDLKGIWIAGASNAYGGFIEDGKIFPSLLQERGFSIANLASEGHRIPQQVLVIRNLSKSFRPQAILLEVSLNNALSDYEKDLKRIVEPLKTLNNTKEFKQTPLTRLIVKIKHTFASVPVEPIGVKSLLINHSAFYCWLKVEINSIPFLYSATLKWGLRKDVALADSIPVSYMLESNTTSIKPKILSTVELIDTIANWIKDNLQVPFGVILIPSQHHLNKDRFHRYLSNLRLPVEDYNAALPLESLSNNLALRGIKVLDTSHVMLRSGRKLNFPDDGHTNELGHRILADEIGTWLETEFNIRPKK